MKQLLRIQSVPISIEMKTHRAQMQQDSQTVNLEISRDAKGLTIKSTPIKLNIDSFQAHSSVMPTVAQSIEEYARLGREAAYEASARFMEEGNMLLDIHLSQNPLADIAAQRFAASTGEFTLHFIPNVGPDIQWQPHNLEIAYEMDKLNFDWNVKQSNVTFIPGSIEITVKEYNKVVFEYIGDPIYVPASANPNYVPLDIKA